jgi:hypothetical protein
MMQPAIRLLPPIVMRAVKAIHGKCGIVWAYREAECPGCGSRAERAKRVT